MTGGILRFIFDPCLVYHVGMIARPGSSFSVGCCDKENGTAQEKDKLPDFFHLLHHLMIFFHPLEDISHYTQMHYICQYYILTFQFMYDIFLLRRWRHGGE